MRLIPIILALALLGTLTQTRTVHASPRGFNALGPGGQWSKLPEEWPFGRVSDAIYDPPRNRLLLISGQNSEVWAFSFDGPSTWQRFETVGAAGRGRFVHDPIGDRIISVLSSFSSCFTEDSFYVWQLTLSEPMTWSRIPSVHSPTGSNWSPSGIEFDAISNRAPLNFSWSTRLS